MDIMKLQPIEDPSIIDDILDAAAALDPENFRLLSTTGGDVGSLSANTVFDGLEVVPDGVFKISDTEFQASATVYVTLNYGGGDDAVSMPDSYPAVVTGTLLKDVAITSVNVDISSFYE